ncbi:MAG: YncE family protein [Nitrospiria bacterium]
MQGDEVIVQFDVSDAKTGAPVTGLHPAAWLDVRRGQLKKTNDNSCKLKVNSFMKGSLNTRPAIDLNTYYILVLNNDPSISVIDPLVSFGGNKLITMIPLDSPGADLALSQYGDQLFVSHPETGRVSAISTTTWRMVTAQRVGTKPMRLALQPDGKYLWVENKEGAAVVDPESLKVIKQFKTGGGAEIAFSPDSGHAFVGDKKKGQVAVINTKTLKQEKTIDAGQSAASLAYSSLSQSVYVMDQTEGMVAVIDGKTRKLSTRIRIHPGAGALRFSPDGRWGFLVNPEKNQVHIIDAAKNRLFKTLNAGKRPDKIAFTETFAYVRSLDTEHVFMVRLDSLGDGKTLSTFEFQGGQHLPNEASKIGLGDAIVPTPERNAVLVANPADKTIHYYKEGMNAMMGSFKNERREPNRLLLLDRSLRETKPGRYIAGTKLAWRGIYDVAFLLDKPRVVHCFDLKVAKNPDLQEKRRRVPFKAVSLLKENKVYVGEEFKFQFKLIDTDTDKPQSGAKDVNMLTMLSPGIWQRRDLSKPIGDGIYETTLSVPKKGIYYLFFESSTLKMNRDEIRFLVLHAVEKG